MSDEDRYARKKELARLRVKKYRDNKSTVYTVAQFSRFCVGQNGVRMREIRELIQ